MKKYIVGLCLILSSLNAWSVDYICTVRQYRVDLDLRNDYSTHFWLTDTMNYETLAQGYAKFIEKKGERVDYHFYPGNASPVKMTFNSSDTINLPQKLVGRIETKARGFLLWDKMNCSKK